MIIWVTANKKKVTYHIYGIFNFTYIQTFFIQTLLKKVFSTLIEQYNKYVIWLLSMFGWHSLTVMFLFQCWQQHAHSWQQVNDYECDIRLLLFSAYGLWLEHTSSYSFISVISVVSTETVITCGSSNNVQRLSCGMTLLCVNIWNLAKVRECPIPMFLHPRIYVVIITWNML